MIEAAEEQDLIKPGDTIVEPTSGNTGIGLALAAIVKGYKMIVTIPDKMSTEKINLLKALGAEVIVTPTSVEPDDPSSYIKVAERITGETPRAFMPNQYFNAANPEIHYRTTGPEIWEQTDRQIDVFVAGIGTGGTISGVGRYLKEMNPEVRIVGADPEGSMYHHEFHQTEGDIHTYLVEGIGEDFMPSTLDMEIIDEIVTVSDRDAMLLARELVQKEGILAGGSSGAAMFATLQVAKSLDENQTIVVLFPDTGKNYLSRIYDNDWMIEKGFLNGTERAIRVSDLLKNRPRREKHPVLVESESTLQSAVTLMEKHNLSLVPVVRRGIQVGSISALSLMRRMENNRTYTEERVEEAMDGPIPTVSLDDTISVASPLLRDSGLLIVVNGRSEVVDTITTVYLLNHVQSEAVQ